MAIPKLFLYKAQNANTVVILRRGITREEWEMIQWDLDTDTFTKGQWLMKKNMNGAKLAISPDGNYFAYHYQVYGYVNGKQEYKCHGVISKVPNFTALYFNDSHLGNWETINFTEKGEVIYRNVVQQSKMEKRGDIDLPFVDADIAIKAPSGYIDSSSWKDPRGRTITHKDGVLFADNQVLYDTTDHVFVPRKQI